MLDEISAYPRKVERAFPDISRQFTASVHALIKALASTSQVALLYTLAIGEDDRAQDACNEENERAAKALAEAESLVGRSSAMLNPTHDDETAGVPRVRLFESVDRTRAREIIDACVHVWAANESMLPPEADMPEIKEQLTRTYLLCSKVLEMLTEKSASLSTFQRTRCVLRLMAAVIYTSWERGDGGLLILPASILVDAPGVLSELTRYLPPASAPITEKGIDGPHSLPVQIDRESPMLGRCSAYRRVARILYLGSVPAREAAKKRLDDQQMKLGCVQPGEVSGTLGNALRKLADRATYLYVVGGRCWYSPQPSVNRLAAGRSERYHPEDVVDHIRQRFQCEARSRGDFANVHPCPLSFSEVVHEPEANLMILSLDYPHSAKSSDSPARQAAAQILVRRGTGRNCGNILVSLAADKARFANLDRAVRLYLAWKSIDEQKADLDLGRFQHSQVEQKLESADQAARAPAPETYCWQLTPGRKRPEPDQAFPPIEWTEDRLMGKGSLTERASKKLKDSGLLITSMAGTRLRLETDRVPLWRANDVGVEQLVDGFATYLYLQRVNNAQVIVDAIQDGVNRTTWSLDTLAYADYYDATANRYRGLEAGWRDTVQLNGHSVLVKPGVAVVQQQKEAAASAGSGSSGGGTTETGETGNGSGATHGGGAGTATAGETTTAKKALRRLHAEVELKGTRLSRDVDQIASAAVQHLTSPIGSKVTAIVEVNGEISSGAPDNLVRTVTENSRTLKFEKTGLEES